MQIESFPVQPVVLGNFILGTDALDAPINTGTLQTLIQSYLYRQYSDDDDLQAFVNSFNALAQGYLDWFTATPLGVYTSASINGPLLDWVGEGVYGIPRPVLSTLATHSYGSYNTVSYNSLPYNARLRKNSGTAQEASDDIYKRVLTWHLYLGDGRQMSLQWLRRRVARFLFGANGTDIPVDYLSRVSLTQTPLGNTGGFPTAPYNTQAYNSRTKRVGFAARSITITVPLSQVAQNFQTLLNEGYLALPFQVHFRVVLQS
ncbi:hypothetical protein [Paraburkholderia caledonica]|uniref:Phage tail protein n=1 Tax=Paraburkholderia caledonica TaxID=134536 RepID=A0AB73IQQ0_9BURK|nr:hypothetical protein [Paraburkholderia caledonica]